MFIAIDPGENVGMATFSDAGLDIKRKIFRLPQFRETLALLTAASNDQHYTFIMENFNLRLDKALDQTGSNMPAARAIGAVEMIDDILGSKSTIVMRDPRLLYSALKAAGYARYANKRIHPPDDIAAYAHGVDYLIEIGLRRHPVLDA